MRLWPVLLLPLAACAGRDRGCGAVLANTSGLAVEQVYLAAAGAPGWGRDLLAPGELAPGATLPLRFAGPGPHAVRTVWVNGRAAELSGIEACRMTRVTVRDAELLAE